MSSPTRVILKAVCLMTLSSSRRSQGPARRMAWQTTPGPLTPTWITTSGRAVPWKAPAMKGLSSTALAKTTNLAQPMLPRSRVR